MLLFRINAGLCMLLVIASHAQGQKPLKWKFSKGQKLSYRIEQKGQQSVGVEQKVVTFDQTFTLDTTWRVNAVTPEGDADIVLTINRLRFSDLGTGAMAVAGGIRFDSNLQTTPDRPPAVVVANVLNTFVGPEIELKVSAHGAVTQFHFPKALITTFKDCATQELGGFFGPLFTAEGVRSLLTDWLVKLPDSSVSPTYQWTEEKPSGLGKSTTFTDTYLYHRQGDRDCRTVAQIDANRVLNLPPAAANNRSARIKFQNGKRTFYFDPDSGCITKSELTQQLMREYHETEEVLKTTVKLVSSKH
jgi:hypothetical protein